MSSCALSTWVGQPGSLDLQSGSTSQAHRPKLQQPSSLGQSARYTDPRTASQSQRPESPPLLGWVSQLHRPTNEKDPDEPSPSESCCSCVRAAILRELLWELRQERSPRQQLLQRLRRLPRHRLQPLPWRQALPRALPRLRPSWHTPRRAWP